MRHLSSRVPSSAKTWNCTCWLIRQCRGRSAGRQSQVGGALGSSSHPGRTHRNRSVKLSGLFQKVQSLVEHLWRLRYYVGISAVDTGAARPLSTGLTSPCNKKTNALCISQPLGISSSSGSSTCHWAKQLLLDEKSLKTGETCRNQKALGPPRLVRYVILVIARTACHWGHSCFGVSASAYNYNHKTIEKRIIFDLTSRNINKLLHYHSLTQSIWQPNVLGFSAPLPSNAPRSGSGAHPPTAGRSPQLAAPPVVRLKIDGRRSMGSTCFWNK